jgi:hypothetical protein
MSVAESAAPTASGEAEEPNQARIARNDVVRLFGTPDETVGAVNEARIRDEHGVEFNEKWIYNRPRNEPTRPLARAIYWQRYDFVASARIERSGQWVRESEAELLAREPAGAH